MSRRNVALKVLRNELVPSFGCTEPVAVGLATSIAYHASNGLGPSWLPIRPVVKIAANETKIDDIRRIVVNLDRFTYRNGLGVDIPGIERMGIVAAAASGVFCDPNKMLSLFEDLGHENAKKIDKLIETGKVKINVVGGLATPCLYINAQVVTRATSGTWNRGIAIIRDSHTNVTFVGRNGRTLYRKSSSNHADRGKDMKRLSMISLTEMIDAAKSLPKDDFNLVLRAIEMNIAAAKVGTYKKTKLKIGHTLKKLRDEKILADDVNNRAIALTSAAVDARMSGCIVPVMSCAGSGNQGLAATLPIVAVAEKQGWDEKRIVRSVALSYIITCYCTSHLGYLSTFCGGADKAGIGATAGIVYYLGGNPRQINSAMRNMIQSVAGILCDGANTSCALKLAAISGAAVESALLALKGVSVPPQIGIKGKNLEEMVKNLRKLSDNMTEVDNVMLKIIGTRL
ncbi:MAG: L-serine ammonia-lyase, iron-sulfur-dependent, subunit alpha [Candidatus Bathyarchaeia archaeon]|jgi:L-cysteine desulfidase